MKIITKSLTPEEIKRRASSKSQKEIIEIEQLIKLGDLNAEDAAFVRQNGIRNYFTI